MKKPIDKKISQYNLSESEIIQLKRILATPIDYISHQDFRRPRQMATILDMDISFDRNYRPDYDQEKMLFMRFNYYRYKRDVLRRSFLHNKKIPKKKVLALIQYDIQQQEIKDQLVTNNIGLVMSMAQRMKYTWVDYEDLVSEGNLALMQAADRFDCSFGFRFSTYACRAILRRMSRFVKRSRPLYGSLWISWDPLLEKDNHIDQQRQEHLNDRAETVGEIVRDNLANLTETELHVLRKRFSLGKDVYEPMTLKEIGLQLNLSKERIRQIQNTALEKVRQASEEHIMAVSA